MLNQVQGAFRTLAPSPAEQIPLVDTVRESHEHLGILDGMRGLAALYVLLHHVYIRLLLAQDVVQDVPTWYMSLLRPLAFGHYAVDLFIVLSGYCLMLPVMRNHGALRGGFRKYVRGRARRILPPYYAALIFSLLMLLISRHWESSVRIPDSGNLTAHVLLLHNLKSDWAYTINAPMWSVATEWQIYFLFPLLLILWRKWGSAAAVLAGFAAGYGVFWLTPERLSGASPWFLGLFTLGMVGAAIQSPAASRTLSKTEKMPWGILFLVLMSVLVLGGIIRQGWFKTHPYVIDPVFGLAAVCLILYCVQANRSETTSPPAVLKVLGSRAAVTLGVFSYSLYLTHYPLLDMVSVLILSAHISFPVQTIVLFASFVPLAVGFSYVFYTFFERPFLRRQ